jgi:hypothetical protein
MTARHGWHSPDGVAAFSLQRAMWRDFDDPSRDSGLRALHVTGSVAERRLVAAIGVIREHMPLLTANPVQIGRELRLATSTPRPVPPMWDLRGEADPSAACVALLLAERDRPIDLARDELTRFRIARLADDEYVLAVIAHRFVLDERSLYGVLAVVWYAYFDRFRPADHPDFTEVAHAHGGLLADTTGTRQQWWSRELSRLAAAPEHETGPLATRRIRLPYRRWAALTAHDGMLAADSSLATAALVAWCLHGQGRPDGLGFRTSLDLRVIGGFGSVMGPFTDLLPFRVDLAGLARPSFRDVMLRAHSGVLDSVVHYLPYPSVVDIGVRSGALRPPRTARRWDVALHICQDGPRSAHTRGDASLAELGLSIELFREADLLGAVEGAGGHADGVTLDVHVGELGDDMAIIFDYDTSAFADSDIERLADDLAVAVSCAADDPEAPLGRFTLQPKGIRHE